MNHLLKYATWIAVTGIPLCVVYLTDVRDLASNLEADTSNITPVLGSLLPFIVIGLLFFFSSIIIAKTVRWGWNQFLYIRDWERYTLREALQGIKNCRIAIEHYKSTHYESYHSTATERMSAHFQTEQNIKWLRSEMSRINVTIPPFYKPAPQDTELWIQFLIKLEILANVGNVQDAKELRLVLPKKDGI